MRHALVGTLRLLHHLRISIWIGPLTLKVDFAFGDLVSVVPYLVVSSVFVNK